MKCGHCVALAMRVQYTSPDGRRPVTHDRHGVAFFSSIGGLILGTNLGLLRLAHRTSVALRPHSATVSSFVLFAAGHPHNVCATSFETARLFPPSRVNGTTKTSIPVQPRLESCFAGLKASPQVPPCPQPHRHAILPKTWLSLLHAIMHALACMHDHVCIARKLFPRTHGISAGTSMPTTTSECNPA